MALFLCRVKGEGFAHRYQRPNTVHVDRIYTLMYPELQNNDYTDKPNRVNRIQNVELSRYEMLTEINGPRHVQLVNRRKPLLPQ